MVMVAQLIHGALDGRGGHAAHVLRHGPEKGGAVLVEVVAALVGVLLHAGEEVAHRLHEGVVVHDGVPLVAPQPFGGVAVVLGHNQHLVVHRLDPAAELLPEHVVEGPAMAQVGGHVQAPAVNGVRGRSPFFRHTVDGLTQGGVALVIQLGQGVHPPPGLVFAVEIKAEEIVVGAGGGGEGALAAVEALPVHPAVEGAAVVEDAV